MNVITAKTAGFCFGVKRAIDLVEKTGEESAVPVYTYGPIIHNEDVVKDLEEKGITVLTDDMLGTAPKGKVILRSHGVTPDEEKRLKDAGFETIDGTCPFVKKIHNLASKYSDEGYYIIITGDPNHAEVKGIIGYIKNNSYTVVSCEEDVECLELNKYTKVALLSQTTFNLEKFHKFVEIIAKKGYDVSVLNTVCDATAKRQEEAAMIAQNVDLMLILGSKSSSNTQKLYDICSVKCKDTYYIQSISDLTNNDHISQLHSINVGISAGASTPNKIIQEVQKYVRKL